MTDAQVEDLKAKKDKLMTSAQNLFTKMYEAAAQAQQGAQGQQMQEQTREQQTMICRW